MYVTTACNEALTNLDLLQVFKGDAFILSYSLGLVIIAAYLKKQYINAVDKVRSWKMGKRENGNDGLCKMKESKAKDVS